jgi:hypothetical protein
LAEGSDVELCLKNQTEFPAALRQVFVTDYMKKVDLTQWPQPLSCQGQTSSGNIAQCLLKPTIKQTEIYAAPNGFTTTFYSKDNDPNTWCLSDEKFASLINPFKGDF